MSFYDHFKTAIWKCIKYSWNGQMRPPCDKQNTLLHFIIKMLKLHVFFFSLSGSISPCENIYLFNFFSSQNMHTHTRKHTDIDLLAKSVFKWFACVYKWKELENKVNKSHFWPVAVCFLSPEKNNHHLMSMVVFVSSYYLSYFRMFLFYSPVTLVSLRHSFVRIALSKFPRQIEKPNMDQI